MPKCSQVGDALRRVSSGCRQKTSDLPSSGEVQLGKVSLTAVRGVRAEQIHSNLSGPSFTCVT